MTSHLRIAGGRASARFLLAAAVIVSGVVAGAAPPADRSGLPPEVTVREERGVYTVSARFQVPQPSSVAHAVLTDFEQIPRFMPHVKTSIVRERFAGGVLVEQEAVSRIMMFSKRVHLLLDVRDEGEVVRFHDECGRSFTHYAGTWTLSEQDGQTTIVYELTAEPAFDVPQFLLTRLLARDSRQMIERLRTEIAARVPPLTHADRPQRD